jgi:hypothetical protein
VTGALGIPRGPAVGTRVATAGEDVPQLAGTVAAADDASLTLLLDTPTPGIGYIGAGGPGEDVFVFVRAQLFGDDAAAVAAHQQTAWDSWFARETAASA